MPVQVEVVGGEVRKVASGSGDVERLASEALVLELAAVPGVVEVLGSGPTGDGGFELVTALAGERTLAGARFELPVVAGVVGALASTVADLHDLGVVHGRVRAEHVVLHGSGRPVLCGFGGAGRIGQVVAGRELRPADDVEALGELLLSLLWPADTDDWEPIPERRVGRRPWGGFAQRALLNLADQACAEDPSVRPSARALAEAVVAAVPGACLASEEAAAVEVPGIVSLFDGVLGARPVEEGEAPWRRVATVAAAAVGLGLVVFGAGSVLRGGGAPVVEPVAAAPAPVPVVSVGPTSTVVAEATPTTAVVEVDGARYGVGEPGDHVLVDDWDCDGTTTAAVVRSSTGEVFVFDAWPAAGEPMSVAPVARVEGAVAAEPGPGCTALVVTAADGTATELPWAPS